MFAIPVNCEVAHAGIFGGTRKLRSQRFFALTKLEIDYFKLNLSLNRWNNTPRNMYNNNHTKREARVSYIDFGYETFKRCLCALCVHDCGMNGFRFVHPG